MLTCCPLQALHCIGMWCGATHAFAKETQYDGVAPTSLTHLLRTSSRAQPFAGSIRALLCLMHCRFCCGTHRHVVSTINTRNTRNTTPW